MSKIRLFSKVTICLLLLVNCKPKREQGVSSLQKDTASIAKEDLSGNNIDYDSISNENGSAPSLYSICSLAANVVRIKDSLKLIHPDTAVKHSKDNLIIAPIETKGYHAILAYRQLLASGAQLKGNMPDIIRQEQISDKLSLEILPKVKKSKFPVEKQFFFLGGGPFLTRFKSEDGKSIFTDSKGKPEIRYTCSTNVNTNYLLDAILHLKKIRINVTFGPPIPSYEMGPQELKGIGSLIHEFTDQIPVYFLTESGIVPARLVSIKQKIVPANVGCDNGYPNVVFACSSLPDKEIIGIYIPYDSTSLPSCIIHNVGKLWTADINDDGVPELAGVSDTFSGISSDKMARIFWYVNINGEWKIIDQAEEPDCT